MLVEVVCQSGLLLGQHPLLFLIQRLPLLLHLQGMLLAETGLGRIQSLCPFLLGFPSPLSTGALQPPHLHLVLLHQTPDRGLMAVRKSLVLAVVGISELCLPLLRGLIHARHLMDVRELELVELLL